jgi:hypothetical protein
VLTTLLAAEEMSLTTEDTWGFGAKPSPVRSYMTVYVALALGQHDVAARELLRALESGSFEAVRPRLVRDYQRATSSVRRAPG